MRGAAIGTDKTAARRVAILGSAGSSRPERTAERPSAAATDAGRDLKDLRVNRILTPINIGAFELANRRVHSMAAPGEAAPAETSARAALCFAAPVTVTVAGRGPGAPARPPIVPPLPTPIGPPGDAAPAGRAVVLARLARPCWVAGDAAAGAVRNGVAAGGGRGAAELERLIAAFADAARGAIGAGYDGIEVDGTDLGADGWDAAADADAVLDLVEAVADECPRERLGVRLAPCGGDGRRTGDPIGLHVGLLAGLDDLEIAFVHLRRPPAPRPPAGFFPDGADRCLRAAFRNALVLSGGLGVADAEEALARRFADAVGFDDGPGG